MKKVTFLALTVFSISSIHAQIQIDNSGKVGICGEPSSSYNLKVNGTTNITKHTRINNCLEIDGWSDYISLHVKGSTTYAPLVAISGECYYNYELYVSGETYSSMGYSGSDFIFKKNINKINGATILPKLMKIEGKKYQFKTEDELRPALSALSLRGINDSTSIYIPHFPRGEYYGLIAQDIEKEFPELVKFDSITGTRALNYDGMIPILIEALKEQQNIISNQELRISKLEKKAIKEQQSIIENLQADIASFKDSNLKNLSTIGEDNQIADQIILYQNSPNPFSENTEIRYFLSKKTKDSHINIYDMNGKQIKSLTLSTRGESQVSIAAGEFDAGMYLYSLLADGQLIDTKQMVITD
jgi:hypothetical protein